MALQDIEALSKLQAAHNNGRGISCVRTIVMCLQRGDIASAEAVALNELDKVRLYDDVYAKLRTMLPEFDAFHVKMERLFPIRHTSSPRD